MVVHTKEEYEKVLNLSKEGINYNKISETLNIPASTVYKWLFKNYQPFCISRKFKQSRFWLDEEKKKKATEKAVLSRSKSKKFWRAIKTLAQKNSNNLPEYAQKNSTELAYILGVVYGDGHLGKNTITLKVKDEDFAINFSNSLLKWSGYYCPVAVNKEKLFLVRLYSTPACKFLLRIKFKDIKKWTFNEKSSFLRGLYDSEGYAGNEITFTNSNKNLINLVSFLLKEFSIKHSIIFNGPSKGTIGRWTFIRKKIYRILITNYENKKKFNEKIGFSMKRKNDALFYLKQSPKNNFVTKEIINKIFQLKKQKLTYREIAKELDLASSTVAYHIKKEIGGSRPW
jgi:hypothetical protein